MRTRHYTSMDARTTSAQISLGILFITVWDATRILGIRDTMIPQVFVYLKISYYKYMQYVLNYKTFC